MGIDGMAQVRHDQVVDGAEVDLLFGPETYNHNVNKKAFQLKVNPPPLSARH